MTDTQNVHAPPPGVSAEPLYAVEDHDSLPVAGAVLLMARATGARLSVTADVAAALQRCTTFRSLAGHASYLVEQFPQLGGNVADVTRVLQQVRDVGLLIPAARVCAQVNIPEDDAPDLERTVSCIITCDRPAAVERLLESLLRGARLARQKRLILIDDSRDASNCAANLAAVERFNLLSPTTMEYFGPPEQDQLIQYAIAELPRHADAIRFLLQRESWPGMATYGRARNVALLLTVGERCIIMDDDVLCAAYTLPYQETGVAFNDGGRQADFYRDAQDWQQSAVKQDFDPLLGHGRCLGMGLSRALRALGHNALLEEHLAAVSADWCGGINASSPVLVTQSGSLGDPGTSSNGWLANLEPVSLRRMLARPGGLASALSLRQNWLGQTRPTFTVRPVISQVTGLDNRALLPPYLPALRGEDQLFGSMLDFLHPDSLTLEYDWAVPHHPLEERKGNPAGDATVPRGGVSQLTGFIDEAQPEDPGVGLATRMALLSYRFEELGQLSDTGLTARFRANLARLQAAHLETLEERFRDSSALSEEWRQYLQRNRQACVAALQQSPVLADLPGVPGDMDSATLAGAIRQRATGFAAALRAWEELREVCRRR
ncbi:hypothetical protein Q6D67_12945 [Haliea sp. E1-2-M8]|uniref:hypothetical protein n=1 Tax=Haliea sp. E1-2-M8 TaxID=3064706 RepID=UPI002716ACB4|nr:hypothetical protein [Haliea sp. E1-2-M8]MDO8862610.1 hypothetical protein [Haliea sp. E1-2-M8]